MTTEPMDDQTLIARLACWLCEIAEDTPDEQSLGDAQAGLEDYLSTPHADGLIGQRARRARRRKITTKERRTA